MNAASLSKNIGISVVVITRNRAKILPDCIRHILQQEFPSHDFELIVVDDGSTDDTRSVVASFERESSVSIKYIQQSHQGANSARNTGLRSAQGGIICFLDDDELIPKDHLSRIQDELNLNPDFAGIGGPARDYHEKSIRTCASCSLGAVEVPGKGRRLVPRLLSGNMAIRAEIFQQVGLFDEAISGRAAGRGEENEWFYRASGLHFFYVPDLWVLHRKDHLTLFSLLRQWYQQGRALPLSLRKQGKSFRPSSMRILRPLAHGIIHRCSKGLALAAREIGALGGHLGR